MYSNYIWETHFDYIPVACVFQGLQKEMDSLTRISRISPPTCFIEYISREKKRMKNNSEEKHNHDAQDADSFSHAVNLDVCYSMM